MSLSTKCGAAAIIGLALAGALVCAVPPAAAQRAEAAAKPFDGMDGRWTGTGIITLGSGHKERIRCRVSYDVEAAGNRVEQVLRCASDSYKFDMTADIRYANGQIMGHWSERNRGRNGVISGRARAGQIQALAETSGFSAFFTMTTRGNQQSVKIESKSQEISDVTITLRRAGR